MDSLPLAPAQAAVTTPGCCGFCRPAPSLVLPFGHPWAWSTTTSVTSPATKF